MTPERLQELKNINRTFCTYGENCPCRSNNMAHLVREIERLEAACREKDKRIAGRVRDSVGYQSETEYVLEKRIAELEATVFVPGNWECPKCHFVLSRTSINANTGNFGTTWEDRQLPEPCPNDGTQMQQVTWKTHAEGLYERCTEQMKVSRELEANVERQRITVIRLLGINNPNESIEGACNNRMQEVLALRGNAESDAQHTYEVEKALHDVMVLCSERNKQITELEAVCRKLIVFIEYARCELEPGKSQLGDQFPRQVDADEHIAIAKAAIEK